jgi:SNF2 family DNA or RNA helicase
VLADLSTFRRLYERPLSQANSKNATREQKERGRKQSKALDEITSTFVLRRLQKDVLKSLLPPRMELLLFCRPSSKQCELYQAISDRACKSLGGRDDNPLMLLTELRKLCTHPSLLAKDESPEDHDVSLSGKLVVLDRLIDSIREKHPTDKVVIISNFTTALSVIETCILRRKSLPFVRLDGSVELSARQPMVDAFNNGSVNHSFAFLLSSKAGGCGLNLLGANRLIMVDGELLAHTK